jgi:ferredoxin
MDAIDFSVSPPRFKANCEKDDLCWVICPEGAIIMDNLAETHGRMGMRRGDTGGFHHLLEEAEKAGKFRRLTPLDEVGYDNPIWKMTQTPRFNIKDLYDDDLDEISE